MISLYILLVILLKCSKGITLQEDFIHSTQTIDINSDSSYTYHSSEAKFPGAIDISLFIDPPNGTFSPSSLGVFLWTVSDYHPQIYYSINGSAPTLGSNTINASTPYVQLANDPLITVTHWITIRAVAAYFDPTLLVWHRSAELVSKYRVESGPRAHR